VARKKRPAKRTKLKYSELLPMSTTVGFFLGIGLGALMNNVWLVTGIGVLIGAAVGYYIDRKNNAPYTRRGNKTRGR